MSIEEKTFKYDPLDFDEYIAMCKAVTAEPVVCVAGDNYLQIKEGRAAIYRTGIDGTCCSMGELCKH